MSSLLHVHVDLERLCEAAGRARHGDDVISCGCARICAATSAPTAAASSSPTCYEGRSQQRASQQTNRILPHA